MPCATGIIPVCWRAGLAAPCGKTVQKVLERLRFRACKEEGGSHEEGEREAHATQEGAAGSALGLAAVLSGPQVTSEDTVQSMGGPTASSCSNWDSSFTH